MSNGRRIRAAGGQGSSGWVPAGVESVRGKKDQQRRSCRLAASTLVPDTAPRTPRAPLFPAAPLGLFAFGGWVGGWARHGWLVNVSR